MPSSDPNTKTQIALFFILAVDFAIAAIALWYLSGFQKIEALLVSRLEGLLMAASTTAALLCFMWGCRLLAWHKGYPLDFGYIGLTLLGLFLLAFLPGRKERPKTDVEAQAVLYTLPASLLMLAWGVVLFLFIAWATFSSL